MITELNIHPLAEMHQATPSRQIQIRDVCFPSRLSLSIIPLTSIRHLLIVRVHINDSKRVRLSAVAEQNVSCICPQGLSFIQLKVESYVVLMLLTAHKRGCMDPLQ